MKIKLRDLTPQQYHKWSEKNCKNRACVSCPFLHVNCNSEPTMSWLYGKETFSDKFLDQIEQLGYIGNDIGFFACERKMYE